jgi:hypothetical protein
MSELTGPPLPKPVDTAAKPASRATAVSRDTRQPDAQPRKERGDTSTKNDQSDSTRGREPAVSISGTAAHLHVGEELKEQVNRVDYEGRPIIVTETATFALRPDAGLRPGDDVKLEIVESGKKVTAELFEKNGRSIDPPVRLSLVVIAVHAPGEGSQRPLPTDAPQAPPGKDSAPLPPKTTAAGYSASQIARSAAQTSDTLSSLLASQSGRDSAAAPQAADRLAQAGGPPRPQDAGHAAVSDPFRTVTQNPDPVSGRSSSPDLATLIAAQQGKSTAQHTYPAASAPGQQTPPQAPTVQDAAHLLQRSELTAATSPTLPGDAAAAGLGAKIQAFGTDGKPQILQLVDPSVSRVPPAQLAEVTLVRPLPPTEAKLLPLPVSAFASNQSALAVVETTKGNFVAPLAQAGALAGELVKLSAPEAGAEASPAPTTTQTAAESYKGKLMPTGSTERQSVAVSLLPGGAEAPAGAAQIKAVHTVRAFLTPDGPRTDLRIETSRGDVFVTLPNHARPLAGENLLLLPLTAPGDGAGSALAQQAGQAGLSGAGASFAASAALSSTALSSLSLSAWPTFEQTYALVADADPGTASQLAARGAQGGGKLTNSLLFFLSAAGRADPAAWLGSDAERLLANRDRPLLEQLKGDISRMMGTATDAAGEWRTMLLPFDTRQNDMPLIAILLGQPQRPVDEDGGRKRGGHEDEEDDKAQRFVLEVQFSILGPIQLDGVIRDQNFDLSLHSEKPLPDTLRQDARRLFHDAVAASGFTGSLHIVDSRPFPVNVEEIMAESLPGPATART